MEKIFKAQQMVNRVESGYTRQEDREKFSPEFLPYIDEAKEFLKLSTGIFNTLAGNPDPRLEFILDNENFYFDHEHHQVAISLKHYVEMRKRGASKEIIEWAIGHELMHHADMMEDPRGYLDNFRNNEQKAKQYIPQAMEAIRAGHSHVPEYVTTQWLENFLKEQLHTLYNKLDDIYVNRRVNDRFNRFAKTQRLNQDVRNFYADTLIKGTRLASGEQVADFSGLPKSDQFGWYFLRTFMVPDERVIVSQEVEERIFGYLDRVAEKYGRTLRDEVYEITRPTGEYEKKQHNASARYEWIEKNLEPIFWEYLLDDLRNLSLPPIEKNQKTGEGQGDEDSDTSDSEQTSGEDSEGSGSKIDSREPQGRKPQNPWSNEYEPSSVGEREVRDFLKKQRRQEREKRKEEREKERQARMTPQEKMEHERNEVVLRTALEGGFTERDVRVYQKLRKSIEPYKKDLAEVFERVMKSIQEKISFEWEKYQKRGKFNVEDFIDKYGVDVATESIESIPFGQLDVFEQKDFITKLHLLPKEIRVRLILDGSGSMEGEKILVTRQLAVLIMEALKDFQEQMNIHFRMEKTFVIDTQIVMFGSAGESRIIKAFEADDPRQNVLLARMGAVGKIHANYGATCDDEALRGIDASINYVDKLASGELREFCFEITDGGTQTRQETRDALFSLNNKKVVTRAFQVGRVDSSEREIFERVWGDDGASVENPGQLVEVMAKALENEVLQDKITVVFDNDDED